jgi:hypothetical protein
VAVIGRGVPKSMVAVWFTILHSETFEMNFRSWPRGLARLSRAGRYKCWLRHESARLG